MKITDIKPQLNDEKRVSVFIDNKFAFGITKVDAIYYKLKAGEEISKEKLDTLIRENIFKKARDKALKLLGVRARSKKEIADKLKSDYSDDIINDVLKLLEKYDYINDAKFASMYAKEKFKLNGWSKKRIAYELRLKGINNADIENVFSENDFDTLSSIEKLLLKRLKGKTDLDYKEKQKQFRYLASKGYEFDEINEVMNRILGKDHC